MNLKYRSLLFKSSASLIILSWFIIISSPNHVGAQGCCPDGNSTITAIAGTGTAGYSGDGGPAASAQLNGPNDVYADAAGNIYICDSVNARIRKVAPGGTITTFAGTGTGGFSGDGGAAASAMIRGPSYLTGDAAGDIYFCDAGNFRVRKISPGGIITTIAGKGSTGFSGDGGPALSAAFNLLYGIAVDGAGNVYVADDGNAEIRKITPGGVITAFAGNGTVGYSGDGGPAVSALINEPEAIVMDPAGNLVFNDDANGVTREISPAGIISTLLVTNADTEGYAFCGGNLYFSTWSFSDKITLVNACGISAVIAGSTTASESGNGGPAYLATLNEPVGMSVDGMGNLYVVDYLGNVVRKIAPDCSPTPTLPCATPLTPTPTPTITPFFTPTYTAAPMSTATPTESPTPSSTFTPTPTSTISLTPTATWTATVTPSSTPPSTLTLTWTFTPTCVTHVWPDPYNPSYAVGGTLKISCLPTGTTLSIYTVSGELVKTVKEINGFAQWNGRNQLEALVSSGIYFYVIQQDSKVLGTGKFLVTITH